MRKAAAVCVVMASISALTAGVFPEAASERRSPSGFVLASGPESAAGFTLASNNDPRTAAATVSLDRLPTAEPAAPKLAPRVPEPMAKNDSPAPISLSFYIGRDNGDPFSSLHYQYAWRVKFRAMNLGAGIYKEIPITRTIRLLPYFGIIRSSATLQPSDLFGNRELYRYRLTVFCVGLPLVLRFN